VANDLRPAAQRVLPGWLEDRGHLFNALDAVQQVNKLWAQSTGQLQAWSLFPSASENGAFPALLVRWDEAADSPTRALAAVMPLAASHPLEAVALQAGLPEEWEFVPLEARQAALHVLALGSQGPLDVMAAHALNAALTPRLPRPPDLVLSDNEPVDRERFFRLGNFRLRRFENNLLPSLYDYANERPEDRNERWRKRIQQHVEEYSPHLLGYVQWRWEQIEGRFADRPRPRQFILVVRRYDVVAPDKAPPFWEERATVPLVRWQALPGQEGRGPLEWYDPSENRFRRMR
jgi:hypothetical protein